VVTENVSETAADSTSFHAWLSHAGMKYPKVAVRRLTEIAYTIFSSPRLQQRGDLPLACSTLFITAHCL